MDHVKTLVIVFGGLSVILVPTFATILFQSWTKMTEAMNRNTHAIVKLEGRLELLWQLTQKIPKLESDVTAAHDKLRRRDKDVIVD